MWTSFKNLFARSKGLNAALGEVIFHTPREHGIYSSSFFEWRVKRSLDDTATYISVAMKADSYAGPEGSPTNYISFDLEAAIRLRDNLNGCIEFMRRNN